jgi:hypothetical protein
MSNKIRNPKSEIRKNIEIRNPKVGWTGFQFKQLLAALLLCLTFSPTSLLACAACTGRTDSALAVAMNWGIVTLLGVVLTVLSGVLIFFVHVIRKEETASNDAPPSNPPGA